MITRIAPPQVQIWQATGDLAARASGVAEIGDSFESYQQGDVVGGVGMIAQGLGHGRRDLVFYGADKIAAGGLALAGACAGLPAISLVGGLSGTAIIAYQNRQELVKAAQEGWQTVRTWVCAAKDGACATTDKPR